MKPLSSKLLRNRPQKGTSKYKSCVMFVLLCSLTCVPAMAQKERALKDVFKNDFMIGAALNWNQIFEKDVRGAEIVRTHFNSITPENILKWEHVHPRPDHYDFAASDRFVEFGQKHNMFIVGHT